MGRSHGKGSAFERSFCKELSLWWTAGKDDNVFWRSTTSGARATARNKQGKATVGQYGDITAQAEVGKPLLDCLCMELKRGYNKSTFQDTLDVSSFGAVQEYEQWVIQAIESHKQAGSFSWALVVKRDRRDTLIWLPSKTVKRIRRYCADPIPDSHCILALPIYNKGRICIFGCRWSDWQKTVPPSAIASALMWHKRQQAGISL